MTNILLEIYIISFLDSFTYGLLMPVLNTYILSIGGSHVVTGFLGTLHVLSQLLSKSIIRNGYRLFGRKLTLISTLIIGLTCNLFVGLASSYWIIVFLRVVFYLTNQTQSICKLFVSEKEAKDKHDAIYAFMGCLYVMGFVFGPIISGYLYATEYGFMKIAVLMVLCSVISLFFTLYLPETATDSNEPTTLVEMFKDLLYTNLENIKSIDLSVQMNSLLLKSLTTIGLSVFFMKYTLLVSVHYKAKSIVVGYTVAYQSIIIFISNFFISFIVQKYYIHTDIKKKFVHTLTMLSVAMISICYAISYEVYLISFIPLSLSRVFLDSIWSDLYRCKGTESFIILIDIFIPCIFGVFCYLFTHNAVKFFAIVPLFLALYLTSNIPKIQSTRKDPEPHSAINKASEPSTHGLKKD